MFNVKAENLLENYTRGALTSHRAGNEGSCFYFQFCPSGPTSFQHADVKLPSTSAGATHLNATEDLQLSDLGQVT